MFTRAFVSELFGTELRKAYVGESKISQTLYDKLFMMAPSSKQSEKDLVMYGFDTIPQAAEGAPYQYGDPTRYFSQTITHSTYKYGMQISLEAREDEQYGAIKKFPQMLVKAARHTLEIVAHNVINGGFSNTGYDGVALFATTHPKLGGTQSNLASPGTDLGRVPLKDAILAMQQLVYFEGFPYVWEKGKLLYHPSFDDVVFELLESNNKPYVSDNEKNYLYGSLNPFKDTYLTDTDSWMIVPNVPQDPGLIGFWRVKPYSKVDEDSVNDNYIIKYRFRVSFGYNEYLGMYGNPGI